MLKALQMTKLEHMILHLKSITLQNNYTPKLLNLHHKNNLFLLNLKTQITKKDLHIKNIVHTVTEQITPSLLVSKDNEMMKANEMLMLDPNLHKNHLYSTSVLLLTMEQNTLIIDLKVEVLHVTTFTTRPIHKINTVLHLEIDLAMTKVLLLHKTLDHVIIHTNVIPGPTVLPTDLHTDPDIDTTLVLDTDHAPIPETTNSQNIQIHTDHLPDQAILDFLDPVHTPIPEIKSLLYNHKTNLNL